MAVNWPDSFSSLTFKGISASKTTLPHANHHDWRSNIFELDERSTALDERVNPPFITLICDEKRDTGEGAIAQVLFFFRFEEVLLKQAKLLLDLLNWMFESSLQLSAQGPEFLGFGGGQA